MEILGDNSFNSSVTWHYAATIIAINLPCYAKIGICVVVKTNDGEYLGIYFIIPDCLNWIICPWSLKELRHNSTQIIEFFNSSPICRCGLCFNSSFKHWLAALYVFLHYRPQLRPSSFYPEVKVQRFRNCPFPGIKKCRGRKDFEDYALALICFANK